MATTVSLDFLQDTFSLLPPLLTYIASITNIFQGMFSVSRRDRQPLTMDEVSNLMKRYGELRGSQSCTGSGGTEWQVEFDSYDCRRDFRQVRRRQHHSAFDI